MCIHIYIYIMCIYIYIVEREMYIYIYIYVALLPRAGLHREADEPGPCVKSSALTRIILYCLILCYVML